MRRSDLIQQLFAESSSVLPHLIVLLGGLRIAQGAEWFVVDVEFDQVMPKIDERIIQIRPP